jgi:hypothetical protein
MCRRAFHIGLFSGGTRTFAFVAGGLIPEGKRGTTNNQLMHVSDWYVTLSTLAGVDPSDKWRDPVTGLVHNVDGINQWPSIITGSTSPRTLPTTHKSLLVDDNKGHMWCVSCLCSEMRVALENLAMVSFHCLLSLLPVACRKLINGNETRADRFYPNGSVYEDPFHECLPGDVNGSYGIHFDCINSLGIGGGGGRMSCVVCSDDQPCLFDVIADPGETKNLAKAMPTLAASMKETLDTYLPYVPQLSPGNLDCYNCSFNATAMWRGTCVPSKQIEAKPWVA